jgi:tetratricopeptide (TPR) repeat protein
MDLPSLIISLIGVTLLLLQASSCLFKPERPFSIGFLNLTLAALVLFNVISLYSGAMVLAPEFGVILIRGAWVVRLFRIALILTAILPSLAWYRIRILNKWISRLPYFLLPGLAIGLFAGFRVHAINASEPEALQVFAYDVWFPPLMVWFVVCFSVMVMAIVVIRRKLSCVSFTAALITPLAAFALRFPDLPDHLSRPLWLVLERVSFGIAVFIIAFLVTESLSKRWRIPSLLFASMLGLIFAVLDPGSSTTAWIGFIPLCLWLIGWLAMVFSALFSGPDEIREPEQHLGPGSLKTAVNMASVPFSMQRIRGTLVALSLPAIFAVLVDIFSFCWVPRWLDVGALLLLWMFFAERLAEGALTWVPQLVKDGVLQLPRLKAAATFLGKCVSGVGGALVAVFNYFKSGGALSVTAKLLILPIAYLVVLTICNELFNYKKIVIRDFNCTGCAKDAADEESKGFVTALINEIGQLRADLLPDAIIAQRSTGKDPTDIHLLSAGADSSAMESVVAKSEDLQVTGLKIPMKIFVDPIQDFVRRFLAIRTIEGSLRFDSSEPDMQSDSNKSEKRLTIFANSSNGDSWRVASYGEKENSNTFCSVDPPPDQVMKLVRKLAFEIAKSDPAFKDVGFTSNPEALQYFRQGLKLWRSHESRMLDPKVLRDARACFQEAVKIDPKFAAAQYRLGLALQDLFQADAAIAAFRATFEANPKFLSGKILEAVTFGGYSSFSPTPAAALNIRKFVVRDKKPQAYRIWTQLAQLPASDLTVSQLRSVYFGICQYDLDTMLDTNNDSDDPEFSYLPYFYCSQVVQLLKGLPQPLLNDSQERTLEGNALNNLGVTLESHRRSDLEFAAEKGKPLPWTCDVNWIRDGDINPDGNLVENAKYYVAGSKYSSHALKYFQQSLKLLPYDDVIQCNTASAQFYLNPQNRAPMNSLNDSAETHRYLGSVYESKVWNVDVPTKIQGSAELGQFAYFFRSSLLEYKRALDLEPDFLDALNGYAYTYWEWRLASLENSDIPPPLADYAALAETYARRQVLIAGQRGRNEYLANGRDTLAEVLIGLGRFHEAIQQSEAAFKDVDKYILSGPNEIRWDAAQAGLCAAANEAGVPESKTHYDLAVKHLEDIRSRENGMDPRLFLDASDVLDPYRRAAVCPIAPDKLPPPPKELYRPRMPVYFSGHSCNWSGVVGEVHGGDSGEPAMLHVWGGGVDETRSLRDPAPYSIVLNVSGEDLPPSWTSLYYFARLEDDNRTAISRTISFSTAKDSSKSPCNSNGIRLIFDRVPSVPVHQANTVSH